MSGMRTPDGVARLPLSDNQRLLCMFDAGDASGPFGPRFHLQIGLRVAGPLDLHALRGALADVVRRHEPLRTRIVRDATEPYQEVFPPGEPELAVRDCPAATAAGRDRAIAGLLDETDAATLDAGTLPLLRAVLLRFAGQDAALVLVAHHTAADALSMRVLARDLAACYAARLAGGSAQLPPVRPYRDFVAWERAEAGGAKTARALEYWTDTLRGARYCALPADHPRSAGLPAATVSYGFEMAAATMTGVARLGARARCSPFMVLLAAYCRLLNRLTATTDIVVSTHTHGRNNARFADTVGSFFNFLPLRIDLSGCRDAGDLLERTRVACLGAYAHEIPAAQIFAVAPDLMAPAMRDGWAPVTFQVYPYVLAMQDQRAGNVSFTEIPRRPTSGAVTSEIPDGALWTISRDPTGPAIGNLLYRRDRFTEPTVAGLVDGYQKVLRDLLAECGLAPHAAQPPAPGSRHGNL